MRDILENFRERWRKQAADKTPELFTDSQLEDMFDMESVGESDDGWDE